MVRIQLCTATLVMITKSCTWTAKTAPYPPCTVTAYAAKAPRLCPVRRQVTPTNFIAGPLGKMGVSVVQIKFVIFES